MDKMTIVLMIIFVFTFIPLVLAEFARNHSIPTLEDFFLQSRKMPLVMTFFTVYATWVSSFAFLGATSSFYLQGPLYMTCFAWNVFFALLFKVIGKRIWFYGKVGNFITPVDFFNDIFGSKRLNIIMTTILIVFTIPYLMIQLYGGAYIIEAASGGLIPWRASGLVFYLVIIIYLWAGGLRAVAMTDVFYGIFTFVAMLATGFIMIKKSGGIEKTFALISKSDAGNIVLGSGFSDNSSFIWLCMFFIIPIGALMGPPIWIRAYSVARSKDFNILPLFLSLTAIMYLGPLLTGSAANVICPNIGLTDNLIPYMLLNNVGLITSTLLLCGIATAALSTANSQIHALSAIYTIDIHKRFMKKQINESALVSIGKWATLGFSAIAYILMLGSPGLIIDTGILGFSGTMQIIVPTLGALFWEKSNGKAAEIGLVTGVCILCILCIFFNINTAYAAMLSLLVNAFLFIIFSLIFVQDMTVREKIVKYKYNFFINR